MQGVSTAIVLVRVEMGVTSYDVDNKTSISALRFGTSSNHSTTLP